MTAPRSTPPAPPRSGLHALVEAELDRGLALAGDPLNASLPDLHLRVTTIHSRWCRRTCRVCLDLFREGDQVRLCPRCQDAFHDDRQSGLDCWRKRFAGGRCCRTRGDDRFPGRRPCPYVWSGELPREERAAAELGRCPAPPPLVDQFLAGLTSVWKPFRDREIVQVQRGSPLFRRICPWCRSRVRAGEWVVACPCGCGACFHQDVFRHLECWNSWNGAVGQDHCPNLGRQFPRSQP